MGVPGLQVIHRGDRYVVIDKPAWMLSVPGKGPDKQDCAAARVSRQFPDATGPLVVHRLDMETSGLLVFGLDAEAQRDLSRQFEARDVAKVYIGLVGGLIAHDSGSIDLPIRPDVDNRPIQIVDREFGRPSTTRWRVLAREVDRTRVQFTPLTGRTHQIRIHAASGLGHPLVGDLLYGGEPADRLMLHAASLAFLEPGSARRVEFRSEPPF